MRVALALGTVFFQLPLIFSTLRLTCFIYSCLSWVTQQTFGVAFWIFPRSQGRRKNSEYEWIAFGLLNVGLLIFPSGLNLIGRILELLSGLSFIKHICQSAKPFEVAESLQNR